MRTAYAVMGTLMLSLIVTVGLEASDEPRAASDDERTAIVAVIRNQIAAFRANNPERAFAYAAPTIQRRFGTPETFLNMVRRAYEPIFRPQSVRFGELRSTVHGPVQTVEIVGPKGQFFEALYMMKEVAPGEWRIGGCLLIPATGMAI